MLPVSVNVPVWVEAVRPVARLVAIADFLVVDTLVPHCANPVGSREDNQDHLDGCHKLVKSLSKGCGLCP